ncbi:hypothetical protein ACFLYL_03000 [Chloroflexota bacterium]
METINVISEWIEEKRCRLAKQIDAIDILAQSLAANSRQLSRYDDVERLRVLKKRIMEQVEQLERREMAAKAGSNKASIFNIIAVFTAGTVLSAMYGNSDATQTGLKLAVSALNREVPFGTVLIAIGKQGLPKDVAIVPLSRLARDTNTSETNIRHDFEKQGYELMTPEVFYRLLDKEENKIATDDAASQVDIEKPINQDITMKGIMR